MEKKFFLGSLLLIFLFICLFVFAPFSLRQAVLALNNSYNKTSGDNLTFSDWNYLLSDFLAKDGGTTVSGVNNAMQGNLDMAGHQIVNLPDTPSADTNAVNKNFVDSAIAAAGMSSSGGIFINWGRDDCPAAAVELYDGVGFSAPYDRSGGGSNPVCVQSGDPGGIFGGTSADGLVPLVTINNNSDLPGSITAHRIVKCAVCHNAFSTCYLTYGSHSCASGFSSLVQGYVLGSWTFGANNSTKRLCVNSNFDNNLTTASDGAILSGTSIVDNFEASAYTEGTFIKCAICCD